MTIEARVITDDVDRALEAINRWIATGSALDIAGDVSLEAARTAFETESDPVTGAPWERLAASTLLAQKRRRGILRVTESLANSFNKGRKGNIFGPGIILAGSIVGSGELILTTSLGAEQGAGGRVSNTNMLRKAISRAPFDVFVPILGSLRFN